MASYNLQGKRFGRLVALEVNGTTTHRGLIWRCQCDCGRIVNVRSSGLRTGISKSCGCYHSDVMRKLKTKHGLYKTAEYGIWNGIKQRCTTATHAAYPDYGGRGITIDPVWLESFESFYNDMGPRPSKRHSIERVNVNGNYEINNCRWATPLVQARNRRNNRLIEYQGKTFTLSEISELTGINYSFLFRYLREGRSIDQIRNYNAVIYKNEDLNIPIMVKDYSNGHITICKSGLDVSRLTGISVKIIAERVFSNGSSPNIKMIAGYDFIDMSSVNSKNPPMWLLIYFFYPN